MSTATVRDPRVDPKATDMVKDREVCEVFCGLVVFRIKLKTGKLSSRRYVGMETWRHWAIDKEVLHVAD